MITCLAEHVLFGITLNTAAPIAVRTGEGPFINFYQVDGTQLVYGTPAPNRESEEDRGDGFPHSFLFEDLRPKDARLLGSMADGGRFAVFHRGDSLVTHEGDTFQLATSDDGTRLVVAHKRRSNGLHISPLDIDAKRAVMDRLVSAAGSRVFRILGANDIWGMTCRAEIGDQDSGRFEDIALVFSENIIGAGISAGVYAARKSAGFWKALSLEFQQAVLGRQGDRFENKLRMRLADDGKFLTSLQYDRQRNELCHVYYEPDFFECDIEWGSILFARLDTFGVLSQRIINPACQLPTIHPIAGRNSFAQGKA